MAIGQFFEDFSEIFGKWSENPRRIVENIVIIIVTINKIIHNNAHSIRQLCLTVKKSRTKIL